MTETTRTILIPSAGGPGSVNLTRSLKLISPPLRTVGLEASPHYLWIAETDVRRLCPKRAEEDRWLEAVGRAVEELGVDFIFPNNSLDGELLSRHESRLGARTFLPSTAAFRLGENKWETWQTLVAASLPVPRTWLVRDRADLEEAFRQVGSPVWVRGAGIPGKGIGVASLPAKTLEQAVQWVEFWNGWGGMIASEYLPGANLTWLGVFDEGRLIASQGRQRDAYVIPHVSPSGITGAPAISHTIRRADINALGPTVCRAIDPALTGPAFVDFKGDAEGRPKITEINVGRLGTTHHFYSAAGANFPELVVRLAFGDPLPAWVRPADVLPEDLYWIRTLDAGPALVSRADIEALSRGGRAH
jgi:carbamoyl-phosphate synthase large subunit